MSESKRHLVIVKDRPTGGLVLAYADGTPLLGQLVGLTIESDGIGAVATVRFWVDGENVRISVGPSE